MEFKGEQPIYIQIADYIRRKILKEKWSAEERIPSIRDMAVRMEVNPNTVARAYSLLQDENIIFNKRGIGYFIQEGARSQVMERQKEEFFEDVLPELFKKMQLLGIKLGEIEDYYDEFEMSEEANEIIQ